MKRFVRLAVGLYPRWWRQRYAREFEALLEDVTPGWRELVDVVKGALMMQVKTISTIPIACVLTGAAAGGIIAMRTPEVFASSATIHLKGSGFANAEPARMPPELQRSLQEVLGTPEARAATTVVMRSDPTHTTVRLTYLDRDPAEAQRVAERLVAAIVRGNRDPAASSEVVTAPRLPTSPIEQDSLTPVASGSAAGLVAGGLVLLVRSRRRRRGHGGAAEAD